LARKANWISAVPRRLSRPPVEPSDPKEPFNIHGAIRLLREAVAPYAKAALFELYEDDGFRSPFEQLVACILSIRTRDETSIAAARRLFARARTPAEIAALSAEEIDALISDSTFHEAKARQVHAIAGRIEREFDGQLPCDEATLLSFHGVGIKCANLVLGIACDQPRIGVDIHVHRVTNRWGYIAAATPEKSTAALAATLPREYWVEINRLLVPFGKHICTGQAPKCSTCPLLSMCRQIGVTTHR
jgi:endonuclease-3